MAQKTLLTLATNINKIVKNPDDKLIELMEVLEAIDETKPSAKINESSMADSKGYRILY